jgi:hypothetical protein
MKVKICCKIEKDLADIKPEIFNLQGYIMFYINPYKLINFGSRECGKEVHRVLTIKL